MMRAAVSFLLIVDAFLGPGMCCCLASHVALALSTTVAEERPASPAPKRACCHCEAEGDKETPASRHTPSAPCPCRSDLDKLNAKVPAQQNAGDDTLVSRLLTLGADIVCVLTGVPVLELPFKDLVVNARSAPFLSTQDLLHVQHMLRC
jgi:hypothetical protein